MRVGYALAVIDEKVIAKLRDIAYKEVDRASGLAADYLDCCRLISDAFFLSQGPCTTMTERRWNCLHKDYDWFDQWGKMMDELVVGGMMRSRANTLMPSPKIMKQLKYTVIGVTAWAAYNFEHNLGWRFDPRWVLQSSLESLFGRIRELTPGSNC
jgi:hypothetical protein